MRVGSLAFDREIWKCDEAMLAVFWNLLRSR